MIELLNIDCMDYMKSCNDKVFDLAVVDVPYGIGEDGASNHSRNQLAQATKYTAKNWDKEPPNENYFKELIRVSKNQIIWGANHFISRIPYDSPCWLVWDKDNSGDFADCELAWTSFPTAVRKVKYRWNGMLQQDMKNKEMRIHPTQKPIGLYNWIYTNYADTKGLRILDTHLGSGSSAISAYYFDLNFVGCEIDNEYFDAMQKRYKEVTAQTKLF